jgi:hypothetical protein
MKYNTSRIFALILVVAAMGFGGCATRLAPDGPYNGDQILFNADKTITSSYRILHSFVKWEHQHRAVLPVEVTKAADAVRANAEKWTQSVINLREAYALIPNKENRSALLNAVDVLDQVLLEVTKHMQDWDGRVTNPPSPISN